MTRSRKHILCLSETPYYHVTARCVRRAFLCGVDQYSGRSYEHRRAWVEDRIRVLSSLFRIDICAYAVMSNHYHLVVRLDPGSGGDMSDDEVFSRWTALFRGPLLVQRHRAVELLSAAECETLRSIAAVYRSRLHSLSWFMKCLNEPIARRANAEDGCSGHFWEARFNSQPLCSDQALMAAMAYVDLNPVRAKIAQTPEASDYTSLQARLAGHYTRNTLAGAVARLLDSGELNHFESAVWPLMPFARRGRTEATASATLPMYESDYCQLVDASGRHVAHRKRGRIDPALAPILFRLGLTAEQWTAASTAFQQNYRNGELRLQQSA